MPESNLPPTEPEQAPRWRREHNRYAIGFVILLHLVLGMFLMLSTSRKPTPKQEQRSVDVVMFQEKVPEPKIPEPKPEPKKLEPPPAEVPPMPELPPVKVAEKPVPAPPVVDAPPAPKAAVAPPPPPPPPPPPKVADKTPPKVFEECAAASDRNMIADVYILRPDTQSVNEMKRRKPVKRVCMSQLNIAPRNFNEGFPGLGSTDWFGLDIRFTVNIAETDTWELMLLSDDGAILSIDGREVINNDGIHPPSPEMATVKLEKGLRNFRVRYYQGGAYGLMALILGWRKPGAADFDYLPRKLIGRPPEGTLPEIKPAE